MCRLGFFDKQSGLSQFLGERLGDEPGIGRLGAVERQPCRRSSSWITTSFLCNPSPLSHHQLFNGAGCGRGQNAKSFRVRLHGPDHIDDLAVKVRISAFATRTEIAGRFASVLVLRIAHDEKRILRARRSSPPQPERQSEDRE